MIHSLRRLLQRSILSICWILLCSLTTPIAFADLVKPALVEISAIKGVGLQVELRASIEALLTGINAQYKDTTEAPNSEQYDLYREMSPEQLWEAFEAFHDQLLNQIEIEVDGQALPLNLGKVDIPERGYTKVPRISLIILEAELPPHARSLTWYYPASFGDNAVRVRQVDPELDQYHWSSWQWIRDDSASEPFSLTEVASPRDRKAIVLEYIEAGFAHILPAGVDHILFIIGLYLYSTRLRPLLWQVSMFTLAHTITLGLSMYGWVSLPAALVEPLIALSIAYVGIENVWQREQANARRRTRLALVFAFGLLHGLGFASMLSDFGMPQGAFFTALISFNVGVELGQLAVLLSAALALGLLLGRRPWYRALVAVPASLCIGLLALYWFWDRLEWPIS